MYYKIAILSIILLKNTVRWLSAAGWCSVTGKVTIFIDASINDSDFAKCSAGHHLRNHCTWPRLRAKRWFWKFVRNLWPHCFGEDNRVEHFSNFSGFCSTFRTVRNGFGVPGRQKSHIYSAFCLLSGPRATDSECPVDKNHTFTPLFVYFQDRAQRIRSAR